VYATSSHPYKDDNYYLCYRVDDPEKLSADSIESLYEKMGDAAVNHMLHGEKMYAQSAWDHPLEEFTIEFSNIFVEVEIYSEEKMKASKTFQAIGAERERQRAIDAKRKAEEDERRRIWLEQEKERKDREEFERLSKKYAK
jgi:hypothetical protein